MLPQPVRKFLSIAPPAPLAAATFVLIGLAVVGALSPHRIVFAQRPAFEVASIKVNIADGPMDAVPRRSGDLVMMHNTQPYSIIYYAYRLRGNYQMVGYVRLPEGWNWYDIDARIGGPATDDQIRLMFQSLLADRFLLKVHREIKELPEFELVIAKAKSKLTPSSEKPMTITIEDRPLTQLPGSCSVSAWRDGSHMVCHAATMNAILDQVGSLLQAPVVDRTGLSGTYDLHVRFIPDSRSLDADLEPGPSLAQALQEELGLKLEKSKGPVEVLVIDHMEKPSPN